MCAERLLTSFINKGECIDVNVVNIKVGGFKNVIHNSLNLEKVTALLSLNGYGKSNVLEALGFGCDFIVANNRTKSKMMAASKCIPRLRTEQTNEYCFSLIFSVNRREQEYNVEYGFSFQWETKKTASKITSEYLRVKLNEKGQKFNSYIDRDASKALYKKSETARCTNVIRIDDNGLVINKLQANDELFYIDIVKSINDIGFFIVKHLDAGDSFDPNPIIWKYYGEKDLEGIRSIPRTVFKLKDSNYNKYELLINSFLQLFPNYESIGVDSFEIKAEERGIVIGDVKDDDADELPPFDIDDAVYVMSVKDKNLTSSIRFENLSDGAKRIFLMLTFAVMADINGLSVLAIEEPENCIHPKLLQDYINVISQLVENCKIVISSHSPYMMQYLNPKGIYIGLPNSKGYAVFKPLQASRINALMRDAAEENESIGGYLFNLIAQSDDDSMLLLSYLEA